MGNLLNNKLNNLSEENTNEKNIIDKLKEINKISEGR